MFGSHGNQPTMAKECRRDLEQEAKYLKKKLDTNKQMHTAMYYFIQTGEVNQLDSYDDRRYFFAVFGSLCVDVPRLEKRYAGLLEEIEKEK